MYLMVLRRPGLCATCQTTMTDVSGASDVLDASSAVCRFPRDCLIGHAAMMTGANAADDMLGTQCGTHGALHRAPTLVSPYCWTGEQPEGPVQSSVSALGRGGAISRSPPAGGAACARHPPRRLRSRSWPRHRRGWCLRARIRRLLQLRVCAPHHARASQTRCSQ